MSVPPAIIPLAVCLIAATVSLTLMTMRSIGDSAVSQTASHRAPSGALALQLQMLVACLLPSPAWAERMTQRIQPPFPTQIEIVPGTLRLSNPSPVELEPIQIEALLQNKGLEDVANLRVRALVSGPGFSSAQVITETEVTLLGGQTAPVRFDWSPPAPGEWQISIAWNSDDQRAAVISTSEDATLKVEVAHRPALEPQTTWEISNVGQPIALVLLLAGLGLGAAVVVILSLRGAGKSG